MAVVGEAVVELRGDDRRLSADIRKAGKDGGSSFSKSFNGESKKGIGKGFRDSILSIGSRLEGVLTIAGNVGPAILAVGAAASAAAAGVTAVVGAIGPAAVGGAAAYAGALLAVQSAMLVTKFATAGLSDAINGDAKAMAALNPAARSFAQTLKGLRPGVERIRASVQRGLFPGLEDSTQRLAKAYFPALRREGQALGTQIGHLAEQGSKMVASGPWQRDFATIAQNNTRNVGLFGRAGLQLADALRSLFVTAQPLIHTFAQFTLQAAKSVNAAVQAGRASGGLAAFWDRASTIGATLAHIVGNVAVAVFNIFKVGASSAGTNMLNTLEQITAQFRAWTESGPGIAALSDFFATGQRNLEAMGRLVGSVASGLSGLGSGTQLAPLLDQLRTNVVPPLLEFLQNASSAGALSALVDALGSVAQLLADISAGNHSTSAFAETLKAVADAAGFIVRNVPGASTALGTLLTVLGGAAALKLVGLGPLITAVGSAMGALATKALVAAGASTTEAGAITLSTLAHDASMSTLGTWLGVKALEFGAWVRTTAAAVANAGATIAAAAASKVAAGAARVWAAGQWLLNAALDANPIGLVVIAIAALVGGLIYAYKHSETFRNIVQGAFHAVAAAGKFMWERVLKPVFRFLVTTWLNVAGFILKGAAKAFGWVPGIGPKLKSAAAHFDEFKARVTHSLNAIPNKKSIHLDVNTGNAFSDLNNIKRVMSEIRSKKVLLTVNTSNDLAKPHAVGAYRFGGGLAWVGEQGRELVKLPKGSEIIPAGRSEAMARSGMAGGSAPTFNVMLPTGDPEAAASAVWNRMVMAGVGG